MLSLYFICEWVTFFVSLVLLRQKKIYLKLFIPFIFIILCVEYGGYFYVKVLKHTSNHFIYNFSVPLTIVFYFFILAKFSQDQLLKKSIWKLLLLYLVFIMVNLLFMQGYKQFASYNFIAGGILLSVSCVVILFELVNRKVHLTLLNQPEFWIVTGLLLYYLPKSIMYAAFAYLSYLQASGPFSVAMQLIRDITCVLLNSFLCIGFLWTWKRRK